jgi:hypothetical protein
MSSATIKDPWIKTILTHLKFSLDTTFKHPNCFYFTQTCKSVCILKKQIIGIQEAAIKLSTEEQ